MYAQGIKANQGVDNQSKVELGIHVDDPTPTPIPAPTTAPMLVIQGAFSGQHEIRYADENTPASRRKPAGAIQIQINRIVAPGPVPLPGGSTMVGLYTKQPILVEQTHRHALEQVAVLNEDVNVRSVASDRSGRQHEGVLDLLDGDVHSHLLTRPESPDQKHFAVLLVGP